MLLAAAAAAAQRGCARSRAGNILPTCVRIILPFLRAQIASPRRDRGEEKTGRRPVMWVYVFIGQGVIGPAAGQRKIAISGPPHHCTPQNTRPIAAVLRYTRGGQHTHANTHGRTRCISSLYKKCLMLCIHEVCGCNCRPPRGERDWTVIALERIYFWLARDPLRFSFSLGLYTIRFLSRETGGCVNAVYITSIERSSSV